MAKSPDAPKPPSKPPVNQGGLTLEHFLYIIAGCFALALFINAPPLFKAVILIAVVGVVAVKARPAGR